MKTITKEEIRERTKDSKNQTRTVVKQDETRNTNLRKMQQERTIKRSKYQILIQKKVLR